MLLSQLNYKFIADLEHYLLVTKNCGINTVAKYIKNVKHIVNIAVKNEWLDKDPFAAFKVTLKPGNRDFLSPDELKAIEEKEISIVRLDQVRDIFVFCCYTGLAYIDVAELTSDNLRKGIDGELWISKNRHKTETPSNIPLLPRAIQILEKYKDHPAVVNKGHLLPVLSNQKLNSYLKEIADACSITKNLTFHVARHTFATTVTLTNGVPIESVSSMLGHTSIKTTQIYAKVIQKKVSQDMKLLKEKLTVQEDLKINQA
jgi:site-specific recombinase XerD